MSRTVRRKGSGLLTRHVGNADTIDDYQMQRFAAKTVQDCLQKKKAWFQGDFRSGVWGVPGWYCRERNRRLARVNCAEMRRCMQSDNWDDHLPVLFRKDAGYDWW